MILRKQATCDGTEQRRNSVQRRLIVSCDEEPMDGTGGNKKERKRRGTRKRHRGEYIMERIH